ncbi:hypothetical protein K439DRAFT_915968 [Ramaria rubella]|nr:hypothetical protein K439DRAFT_915968 [Ramaria rubella]
MQWGVVVSGTRLSLEATVIGLSLFKSHSAFKLQMTNTGGYTLFTQESLSVFVLRSGVLYFIAAFVLELVNIVFNTGHIASWLVGVANALPLPYATLLFGSQISHNAEPESLQFLYHAFS